MSVKEIGKAVAMTAVSLVIINFGKQYLPDSLRKFLG
ncbi:hypothetical protein DFLDMN_000726 [Cupriavidus sp. H19C3]